MILLRNKKLQFLCAYIYIFSFIYIYIYVCVCVYVFIVHTFKAFLCNIFYYGDESDKTLRSTCSFYTRVITSTPTRLHIGPRILYECTDSSLSRNTVPRTQMINHFAK